MCSQSVMNVMHYSPGLADWVFPECSQSVPWFSFKRVSKFFLKGTKWPTTCKQGLNGSHTLHLGYQLLSLWFNFTRARSISTHTSKKWLAHNNLDEVQPSSTSNSVKPSFDLHNIMAVIQWPPIGPINGNDCVWLVDHNDWPM